MINVIAEGGTRSVPNAASLRGPAPRRLPSIRELQSTLSMQPSRLILALCLLPAPLAAQAGPQDPGPEAPPAAPAPAPEAAPEEATRELAAKQAELSAITEQITQLQLQAETNESVKSAKDGYRTTLRDEMVKAAPDLESDIERQAALVEELTTPAAPEESAEGAAAPVEERQAKLDEYRVLRDKLAPVEQDVQAVPAVQEARKTYYDTLIAEMQRIEPRTPELLAKHRELITIVRELAAQARSG